MDPRGPVAVVLLVLLGLGLGGMTTDLRTNSTVTGGLSTFGVQGSESATCATLESNATLNSTYAQIYNGLGNGNGNGSAWGNSSASGRGAYPNLTTGEHQLIQAWIAICDSQLFVALYDQWGAGGFTSGTQLNGSTGHYQADFGFVYHASCNNPMDNSSADCEYFSTWYVDLATGGVTGPGTTSGGAPLGAPPLSGPGLSPLFGFYASYRIPIIVMATAGIGIFAALGVLRYRRRGKPRITQPPAPSAKDDDRAPPANGKPGDPSPETEAADPLSDVY